jgi:hypothetical protein
MVWQYATVIYSKINWAYAMIYVLKFCVVRDLQKMCKLLLGSLWSSSLSVTPNYSVVILFHFLYSLRAFVRKIL